MKLILLLGLSALGSLPALASTVLPDLPQDLTGAEYRILLDKKAPSHYRFYVTLDGVDLSKVIALGKRNLDWLASMNRLRDAAHQLELSTPETMPAYPIEAPGKSSPSIIMKSVDDLKKSLPAGMKDVLFSNGAFTQNPPSGLTDEEYLVQARLVDKAYQRASRWILQEPFMSHYQAAKNDDVQGYYFLSKDPEIQTKLAQYASLPASDRTQVATWLASMCMNSGDDESSCARELENQSQTHHGDVSDFYSKYFAYAKRHWDSYFKLQGDRTDVDWTSAHPNVMKLPFATPKDGAVLAFLRDNIEDEWRFEDWSLHLNFLPSAGWGTPKVEFVAGATPHVNGLGGNTITMDANRPLTEYVVKWTIRHEFGHVLGLPDCYVEFFDSQEQVMVNYQLDITNLMCSRRGHLKQIHVDELKKAYYKN